MAPYEGTTQAYHRSSAWAPFRSCTGSASPPAAATPEHRVEIEVVVVVVCGGGGIVVGITVGITVGIMGWRWWRARWQLVVDATRGRTFWQYGHQPAWSR